MRRYQRWPFVVVFLLFFFSYIYSNAGWGYNQYSRLDLLHSIVIHGTFSIDAHHGNTGDKSLFQNHYYSDKAPGIAFLALPSFLLSTIALRAARISLESDQAWNFSHWATTAGSVALITALGGAAFFAFLSQLTSRRHAFITVLATFLGSLPFPYSMMLFSHGAVIGLLCIALWAVFTPWRPCFSDVGISLLRRWQPNFIASMKITILILGCAYLILTIHLGNGLITQYLNILALVGASFVLCLLALKRLFQLHYRQLRGLCSSSCCYVPDLVAGISCGLAVASEYTAGIAAIGILFLTFIGGYRRAMIFIFGAIFPLLLIPLYNWACFGSLFTIGYGHVLGWEGMKNGLFGVTFPPNPNIIYALLFSSTRGLLYWTPFFFLSLLGLWNFAKKRRLLFVITWSVIILQILAISGYAYWDGGRALGPRHLAALVPFIALASAFGLERFTKLGIVAALVSILLTGIATLIDPGAPYINDLVMEYYLPQFLLGNFRQNFGTLLGLEKIWSLVPLIIFIVGTSSVLYMLLPRNKAHSTKFAKYLPFLRILIIYAFWALLGISLFARLIYPSLMEFKAEEYNHLIRGLTNLQSFFSVQAFESSLGLPAPAFFTYFLAIPLSFSINPIVAASFIASLNIIGILLLYLFLRDTFGKSIALSTTALISSAPWTIIFSRKIWNPDIVLPFLFLFLFLFSSTLKRYNPLKFIGCCIALALLLQTHLSAFIILPALLLFWIMFRVPIRPRDLLIGSCSIVLLVTPYLLFLSKDHFANILQFFSNHTSLARGNESIEELIAWTSSMTTGLRFDYLLGTTGMSDFLHETVCSRIIIWLFKGIAICSTVAFLFCTIHLFVKLLVGVMCRRRIHFQRKDSILMFLSLVVIVGYIAYLFFGISTPPHYHLIFYPSFTLCLVLCLRVIAQKIRGITPVIIDGLLILLIIAQLYFILSFYRFLALHNNMAYGDYGMPYRYNLQIQQDFYSDVQRFE